MCLDVLVNVRLHSFVFFPQALCSPKGSKRVCRDARRVKWRRSQEKRGCLAIMTNGMQCLTCFREEWCFLPHYAGLFQ